MNTEQAMKQPTQSVGDKGLLDRYAQWHQDKGYWPNETIFGEVKA